MTDHGPGSCETCGEDLEAHTMKQLRKCTAHLSDDSPMADYTKPVAEQRKTTPHNGRTIVQALLEEGWKELDTIVEHIMSEGEPEKWDHQVRAREIGIAEQWQAYGEWRGQAQGIAYMLAVLTNPYEPDIEAIREEAMRRWEEGEE